jgi:DNA-binding transcriptional MerR regulator
VTSTTRPLSSVCFAASVRLKSLGFTLKEIKEAGPSTGEPVSCDQALELVRGKLAAAERLISEAQDR